MGEVHYMISEAAKRVGVEAHVLRYWEEELDLPIGRTEMGHRYYTEDDIRLFHCIKDLKEQSMQLRELKTVIPELKKAREQKKKKLAEMGEQQNESDRRTACQGTAGSGGYGQVFASSELYRGGTSESYRGE